MKLATDSELNGGVDGRTGTLDPGVLWNTFLICPKQPAVSFDERTGGKT